MDVFSTLSAEPAVSDSAAPNTATAAAETVTFFACETSQGRSLRGRSSRGVSIGCVATASTSLTTGTSTVSAAAVAADLFGQ